MGFWCLCLWVCWSVWYVVSWCMLICLVFGIMASVGLFGVSVWSCCLGSFFGGEDAVCTEILFFRGVSLGCVFRLGMLGARESWLILNRSLQVVAFPFADWNPSFYSYGMFPKTACCYLYELPYLRTSLYRFLMRKFPLLLTPIFGFCCGIQERSPEECFSFAPRRVILLLFTPNMVGCSICNGGQHIERFSFALCVYEL
ncbi:hypothetical protein U1Q18_017579 [Sarracenia purpurea var. burkii]